MSLKLGEMLVRAGAVSPDQVEAALGRQRRFGGRLATNLLAMRHADERTLALFLSRQQGVPFVVLSRSALPLDLLGHLPLEVARQHTVMPIHKDGRELFVAMADPKSIASLDELRFVTGLRLVEHGALIGPLGAAIEDAYRQAQRGATRFWEGIELDPRIDLATSERGHVEIAVGSQEPGATPLEDPEPVASKSALENGGDWVDALQNGLHLSTAQASNSRTVLIVDDEPEIRNLLKQFLKKSGYQVWEAVDGSQALHLLGQKLPDAIVLDAMLPGVHGFDICYRVKHAEATRHIPVIMVSAVYRGWRYATDVRRLYGADVYLEKPLRLDELKHTLENALEQGGAAALPEELGQKAISALRSAASAYKQGDLMGSAKHLERAVEAAPFNAELHHRLGLLFDKLDEAFWAIASLERAVELDPCYAHVLALARIYEKTGFIHKAFEAWERCLRACKTHTEAETIKRHMQRLLP